MDAMPTQPAHAKPARRDLLWVLILIAVCGLLEVWASWLQIGSVSGFPKLGPMTTGWILPVTTEAYWTAALYAWLVDPAGPRSKRFAMASGAVVFALSLAGQESDHLLAAAHRSAPPVWVVGFVTALPLIAVALVAVLMHLRQRDREESAETARQAASEAERITEETAEADERTALRAELDALTDEVEPLREALAAALRDAEQANVKAESLAAKLATKSAHASAQKARKGKQKSAQDEEITLEFRALDELQKDPKLREPRMGAELARRLKVSPATGRRLHSRLTGPERSGESLTERSAEQPDERSPDRS